MVRAFRIVYTDGTCDLALGSDDRSAMKSIGVSNSSGVVHCEEVSILPDSEKIVILSGARVTNKMFKREFLKLADCVVGQTVTVHLYGRDYLYILKTKSPVHLEFGSPHKLTG